MTTRIIHTHTKICFVNPIVVKITFEDIDLAVSVHSKICRSLYKLVKDTYGYTTDTSFEVSDSEHAYDCKKVSYFCFKDELDALQFMLTHKNIAKRVKIWPEVYFTIHRFE
jgi:hypothetical protein